MPSQAVQACSCSRTNGQATTWIFARACSGRTRPALLMSPRTRSDLRFNSPGCYRCWPIRRRLWWRSRGNSCWRSPSSHPRREADELQGDAMVALNEARTTPVMSPVSLLLNLIWIVFGGLWMAAGWIIAGVVMAITIIGLPWTRAAFNIAAYTLLPFGQKAVSRAEYFGQHDLGTGPLGVLGNVLWLVLAGWWLALGHLITAIMLAITLIGIPFAWAHLKLA